MSSSDPSKALLMQHFLKDLTTMLSGMAFHAADTHHTTSKGAVRKGRLKERCGLELRTNFILFKKSVKTSADWIPEYTVFASHELCSMDFVTHINLKKYL